MASNTSLKCSVARLGNLQNLCDKHGYSHGVDEYQVLSSCQRDISSHLRTLQISQCPGIRHEWQLILARAGQFNDLTSCPSTYTICPKHRDNLGIRWRQSRLCKYPEHPTKSRCKPSRGIDLATSRALWEKFQILVPVGSGRFYTLWRCLIITLGCDY